MNYRFLILHFSFYILLSCQNKSADLEKFESILGTEKSEVLTELTDDFENEYLAKKYPDSDLSKSYLKFMEEMAKHNFPKREEIISEENEKKYRESGLFDEKYSFPDSVWIENQGVVINWVYEGSNGKIQSDRAFRPLNSKNLAHKDSILKIEKNQFRFNRYGNYRKALEAVKEESQFIDLYYTYVTKVGLVGSSVLFPEIRDNKLDISGPVERRVLVLDMIY